MSQHAPSSGQSSSGMTSPLAGEGSADPPPVLLKQPLSSCSPGHHCSAVLSPFGGCCQEWAQEGFPKLAWSNLPVSVGWLRNSQGQHTLSLTQFRSPWASTFLPVYSAELRLALFCFWHVFFPFCLPGLLSPNMLAVQSYFLIVRDLHNS